jgi:hypothetical protein
MWSIKTTYNIVRTVKSKWYQVFNSVTPRKIREMSCFIPSSTWPQCLQFESSQHMQVS